MSRFRKYGGIVLSFVLLLVCVQAAASFAVRTRRMRTFLIARLESDFGRPVQASDFSIQLFPIPELQMEGVTIGEDPAFGREYFLRAERMAARLRWSGLLRGRFQFGTMSLTRPSLILVRNSEGRWNIGGWLPPARGKTVQPPEPGDAKKLASTNQLRTIEFDDGRVNFKIGDDKRPFAFTNVSGSVEQVSPGRWRLRLEAVPWRSGVMLQSTGTLQVIGDLAGTSARLQPAQIQVHWEKVSMADLFRLVTGNDSGVRGEFALDGNASVGAASADANGVASEWRFQLQARAIQLHRWDLTERSDNPRVNVNVNGFWNPAKNEARAEELRVELPRSNLTGNAVLQTASPAAWHAQFKNMAIQGEDLLAWHRGFQPGLSDQVAITGLLRGTLSVGGWPLRWEEGSIESRGGALTVPGLRESRIDSFRASVRNGKFALDALRIKLGRGASAQAAELRAATVPTLPEDSLECSLNHDFIARQGSLKLSLRLADAERFFRLASAFGRNLQQGWEYDGGANGFFAWNWENGLQDVHRSGSIELTKSNLAIVGLNLPLRIDESRLEWKDGRRSARIGKAAAFGANWSGSISQMGELRTGAESDWVFDLHADRLDATDLDRWFGPRARPNWLQRLLTSLLGDKNASGKANELLRRVSAQGELTADTVIVETIKLAKARANVQFRNLQLQVTDAEAQWAGGNVQGQMTAEFSPVPRYEVTAQVDRANLTQLPWPARWAERWGGTASGAIQLSTRGVGREELLRQLSGRGDIKLSKVELRGWDVRASTESGVARAGTSRWASGAGKFEMGDQEIRFEAIRLDGPQAHAQLSGTLGFDMSGEVTFLPGSPAKRGGKAAQASRGLSLSGPLETPKAVVRAVNEETTQR